MTFGMTLDASNVGAFAAGEKNHVVPTAWQDVALARDGVSREVPCSVQIGRAHV